MPVGSPDTLRARLVADLRLQRAATVPAPRCFAGRYSLRTSGEVTTLTYTTLPHRPMFYLHSPWQLAGSAVADLQERFTSLMYPPITYYLPVYTVHYPNAL